MPLNVKGESHMYIHEMDYGRRQRLVEILDAGDSWKELSQRFHYPSQKVEKFARAVYSPGGSPADALLADWGRGNRTVVELFKHLAHMKHYQAMESLRVSIPERYHKYIPSQYAYGIEESALSTVNLSPQANQRVVGNNLLSDQQFESSAGLHSYRSRSKIQNSMSSTVLPPKKYNQVRDKIVLNNLDSTQRHKAPAEDVKYPKKNIQNDLHRYEGFSHNPIVDLPPEHESKGGLAKQLNQQQNYLHKHLHPNVGAAIQSKPERGQNIGNGFQELPINMNQFRQISKPSVSYGRVNSQGTNATGAESCFKRKILEEGKVPPGNPDIMLKNVDVSELAKACNDFNISNQIGKGGFGVVYRGRWNGQDIAVKRIKDERKRPGDVKHFKRYVNQAINELISLHHFPALNILPLLAYSCNYNANEDSDLIAVDLVYMYMVNGSVSDRLKRRGGTEPLTWEQRANIALGTASGLFHLHSNNIIHGDIKGGNILLDKHFVPKIGDFGLARGGPESDECSYILASSLQGTMSYLPDDYCRSRQLNEQVDTFCFGMFLFELVSGKSPSWQDPDCFRPDLPGYCSCRKRNTMRELMMAASSLQHHQKLVDQMAGATKQNLAEGFFTNTSPGSENVYNPWAECIFRFGKDCTKTRRKDRPQMEQIFNALEKVHQNPSYLHWVATLPISDETDPICSSFVEFDNAQSMKSDVKSMEFHGFGGNKSVHPFDQPLPQSESRVNQVFPIQHSAPPVDNVPPFLNDAPIPKFIFDSKTASMSQDNVSNNRMDVLSGNQVDNTTTDGTYTRRDEDDDSDESNNESRRRFDGFIDHMSSAVQNLPIREDVKELNVYTSNTQKQDMKQPIVSQPLGNKREFDDGIPKLPDLCWGSDDQGEIDPLGRLTKAESAVADASKQDLMSDLPSSDNL